MSSSSYDDLTDLESVITYLGMEDAEESKQDSEDVEAPEVVAMSEGYKKAMFAAVTLSEFLRKQENERVEAERAQGIEDISDEEVTEEETEEEPERHYEDPKDREIVKLQEKIRKLNRDIEQVKSDDKKVSFGEEGILTSINGSWQIVSSVGMEEYLQKWNVPMTYIGAIVFQVGVQKISYNSDTDLLTIRDIIGIHEHFKTELKLGEKVTVDNLTYFSFVKNNSLVTVLIRDDEEFARMKRFVKDGRLHVEMKRFGMSCTRIYEKVGTKVTASEEGLQKRVVELEAELEHKIQNIDLLHEKVHEMIGKKKKDRRDLEVLKEEKRELKETLARKTVEIDKLSDAFQKEKKLNAVKVAGLANKVEKVDFLNEMMKELEVERKQALVKDREASEYKEFFQHCEKAPIELRQSIALLKFPQKDHILIVHDYSSIKDWQGEWILKDGHSPFGTKSVSYEVDSSNHQLVETGGDKQFQWDFSGHTELYQKNRFGTDHTYFSKGKMCSMSSRAPWGTILIERSIKNKCLKIQVQGEGKVREAVFEKKEV